MDIEPCDDSWLNQFESLTKFRNLYLSWGEIHFRVFPWRVTTDPYRILLAEVMLHRTQVMQVVPVYEAFIRLYPDLRTFSKATYPELHSVLYPLGLHWRIQLIYEMGQQLASRFEMQVPQEKSDLLSLPGVSEYIAGAVRCFAWNLPEPLMDTNTVRITGRIFGLEIKDSSRRNAKFRALLSTLLNPENPRSFNYAMLVHAHLICMKKQEPLCQQCPVLEFCCYGQTRMESTITP